MESSRPKVTDSPWFWVYLFGVAALVALFLIGNKADTVQEQRDQNFTRRQHSLELQASAARNAAEPDETRAIDVRYVDFTPFYALLGIGTVFAWVMHWRHYYLGRRSSASATVQGPV